MIMNKTGMAYMIGLALTNAYATLPLDFTSTPAFPITLVKNHATFLEYMVKNNTPVALPLTITPTPLSMLLTESSGTTCHSILQPNQQCRLRILMSAGSEEGTQSGNIKIDYQGRISLQSQPIANVTGEGLLGFSTVPTNPNILLVNQVREIYYTVQNSSSTETATNMATMVVSGSPSYEVDTTQTTCIGDLAPNASCQVALIIPASATPSDNTGRIIVSYNENPNALSLQVNVKTEASAGNLLLGYNLSGFEFASAPTSGDYPTTADANTFTKTFGATMIRVPFRMEYCTDSNGDINNSSYLDALNSFVQTLIANNSNVQVLLDMHNYMRYCPGQSAGSCGTFLTDTQLSNAWKNIANYLSVVKSNPNTVWLDLMNEPNGISADQTFDNEMQAFITLRQQGISNPIALEGTEWTGLHSWTSSGNAAQFTVSNINSKLQTAGVSAGQYAIEVHQYLDSNFSGTSPVCVANANLNGQINFSQFTEWLQTNHVPVILGETGGGLNQVCTDDMTTLYNDAVQTPYSASATNGGFSAITYWGGGQAWGNSYFLGIQPISSLNTVGMTETFAPAQLYLTLAQLNSQDSISPLMTTVPTDMFTSFGVCFGSLYTINLTNDLSVGVSTGNLQFLTGSSTVNAPMSMSLQNTIPGSSHYQLETVCLPTSATELYLYPSPTYLQKSIALSTAPVQPYDASQAH